MPTYKVPATDTGARLDRWLSRADTGLSRARIQQLIKSGHVLLNGAPTKAHQAVSEEDEIALEIPEPVSRVPAAEDIPIAVLYEDEAILAVNKPAGLVVHPAAGNETGTLVNALLHHCPSLADVGGPLRPGIVHRLDKDTSGVLVVAKTEDALRNLRVQFKERRVGKSYIALVRGHVVPESGPVETLIGRHPRNRKKMSAQVDSGRMARTRYATIESFRDASLLEIHIETGRTHQIRVHMSHLGHPVLGDRDYGRARILPGDIRVERQMLHARHLTLRHPVHGQPLEFSAPLPEDMRELIRRLRQETNAPERR